WHLRCAIPLVELGAGPAERLVEMAEIARVRLARAYAVLDARHRDPVGAMVVEQGIDLIRHVAVVAHAARRIGRMVLLLREPVAVGRMATITCRVGTHANLDLVVRLVSVHGMARETTQLPLAILVTGRQSHALVFHRGCQRCSVAPEGAVERFGRGWAGRE